jgi:toxin YoeB
MTPSLDELRGGCASPREGAKLGNRDTIPGHCHRLPARNRIEHVASVIAEISHADTGHDSRITGETTGQRVWAGLRLERSITQVTDPRLRDSGCGTGKPGRLRGNLSGVWSRRIDQRHRLVYTVRDGQLIIVQAREHY